MSPARTPRPPRPPRDLRVRTDDSIGRQEDIGTMVPKPNPYLEADRRNAPPPSVGKKTRITVDLAAEDYELLGRYVAELTPEFHRLTVARTIRAMIRAAPGDYKVTEAITAQLRREHP